MKGSVIIVVLATILVVGGHVVGEYIVSSQHGTLQHGTLRELLEEREQQQIAAQKEERKKQLQIIREGKLAILNNNNTATKPFMFKPENNYAMTDDTKKEIANFAVEHGWVVSHSENDSWIVFEKRNEEM